MSRLDIHTAPNRDAVAANVAKEPDGERIRAELEDFIRRNKIVGIMLDTDEHCVDIDIVKLPPRTKSVLTKWGAIRVRDDGAPSQGLRETRPAKNLDIPHDLEHLSELYADSFMHSFPVAVPEEHRLGLVKTFDAHQRRVIELLGPVSSPPVPQKDEL